MRVAAVGLYGVILARFLLQLLPQGFVRREEKHVARASVEVGPKSELWKAQCTVAVRWRDAKALPETAFSTNFDSSGA